MFSILRHNIAVLFSSTRNLGWREGASFPCEKKVL